MNLSLKNKTLCVVILLTAFASSASAQEKPSAGDVLRQTQENQIQPSRKDGHNTIKNEVKDTENVNQPKDGKKIRVKTFRIEGQTLYTNDQLAVLLQDYKGKEMTLAQLQQAADKITMYYRQNGYIVAKAFVPAQKVQNNTIVIKILEGHYGNIIINNKAGINDDIVKADLGQIHKGAIVDSNKLQHTLLFLNDLAGIDAQSVLKPGEQTGDVDFILNIEKTKPMNAYLQFTNNGNDYSGKNLMGVGISLNNLAHRGDMLSLSGLTGITEGDNGESIKSGSIRYQLPTNIRGLSLGAGYSKINYNLGHAYESLGYNGIAKTLSLSAQYSLSRSYLQNTTLNLSYEDKKLTDNVTSQSIKNSKTDKLFTIGVSRDARDNIGVTVASLNVGLGNLDTNGNNTNQTQGSFTKYNLELVRYQNLTNRLSLYSSLKAQLASKNLDSAEKFFLGGINAVRAYAQGDASGDEGNLFTMEFRYSLPAPATENLQLVAFYDTGRVKINKSPSFTGIQNQNYSSLSGAGIGILWNKNNAYSIKTSYAWKVSNDQASDGKNGRFWLEATRYF